MTDKRAIPDNPENDQKDRVRKDNRAACLKDVYESDRKTVETALGLSGARRGKPGQETQLALNQAFEQTLPLSAERQKEEQRETITRGRSRIEVVDGLVQKVTDGNSSLEYTYKKDADGNTVRLENGKPKIEKVAGSIKGPDGKVKANVNIDVAKLDQSTPEGQRPFSERIRVSQTGKNIGDLSIESADGTKLSGYSGKDFAQQVHERIPEQTGEDDWRIKQVTKLNDKKNGYDRYVYDYDDAHDQPDKLLSRNIYTGADFKQQLETMRLRGGNNYDAVRFDTLSRTPKTRNVTDFDPATGDMASKDIEPKRFVDYRENTGDSSALVAARTKLLDELKKHPHKDNNPKQLKEWMDRIEGKRAGWVNELREKGWKTPDNKDIAETYTALREFFVGKRSGLGKNVSDSYRTDLVLGSLRQLADTRRFGGNQFDIPSCGRAALTGCIIRRDPGNTFGLLAEAVNTGKVTYNGKNLQGNIHSVALKPDDLNNTDQRWAIDELEQKVFARVLESGSPHDKFGTTSTAAKYIHHYFTGKKDALPVLNTMNNEGKTVNGLQWQYESTIPKTVEGALKALKNDSIWVILPGHAERIEDARIDKHGNVEFLMTNSWKREADESFSPFTGYYTPDQLNLRVERNVDYSKYFRKDKKR